MINTVIQKEVSKKHLSFCRKYLLPNIQDCIDQIDNEVNKKRMEDFINRKFDKIITSYPVNQYLHAELSDIVGLIDGEYTILSRMSRKRITTTHSFTEAMNEIFINNYNLFSDINNNFTDSEEKYSWNAYEYTKILAIIVCPYCNSEFIFTQTEDKTPGNETRITIRPDLDHFYSKKDYPYLASSIFNLVPSCKTCNSSIKGSLEIGTENHMNPLEKNPYSYIKFSRELESNEQDIKLIDYYSDITGFSNNLNLDIKKLDDSIIDEDFSKASKTLEFFRIIDRYEPYKSYIQNQIVRELLYNNIYRNNLENTYPKIFTPGDLKSQSVDYVKNEQKFIFSKIINDLLY